MMLVLVSSVCCVFLFKQKTAYEMRISDWSSDVCSSDLLYCRETEVQSTGERTRATARRTKIDHVALPGENHDECFIRPYSMMTRDAAPPASTSGRAGEAPVQPPKRSSAPRKRGLGRRGGRPRKPKTEEAAGRAAGTTGTGA